MDKDRIIGAGKQMMGCMKRTVGRLVGDSKLQVDGKAEQSAGKIQNAVGGVKDTLKH
ncbi:CsbD family protein [Telmatospirillum sp.]|uniref:CsbD family protein n=1 Tax=Telmatospirillum sp. TaxID=2079197 RepID=UPI00284A20C8|nr:CsbD family protein [Telmatospirillum sp.]MDR3440276.1 CsbD family protein [Telmatospirillum sp.]